MQIELFYTRYQPNLGGHMLRSDGIDEFAVGIHPALWAGEDRDHADRAERAKNSSAPPRDMLGCTL